MSEPRFTGFGPGAVDFYVGLRASNSREFFAAHRDTYEADVRGPLELLAEELAPEFGEAKVFRPHRDLRFTPDKRPYKEHAGAVVLRHPGALYVQLSAEGLLVAGGWYHPDRAQLAAFRRAVADGEPGDEVDQLLGELSDVGLELDTDDALRTAPRGYPRDHPRIELLRQRSLHLGVTHPPRRWLHTREALTRTASGWCEVERWNALLAALPAADPD